MGEDDEADHLCSMGDGAATPDVSMRSNNSVINLMSDPSFFLSVPVGKHTSHTHC